jgi:hypothetical protein
MDPCEIHANQQSEVAAVTVTACQPLTTPQSAFMAAAHAEHFEVWQESPVQW